VHGCDKGAYYHPCMVKGSPHLVRGMKRTKIKGTRPRRIAPEDEPNFYGTTHMLAHALVGTPTNSTARTTSPDGVVVSDHDEDGASSIGDSAGTVFAKTVVTAMANADVPTPSQLSSQSPLFSSLHPVMLRGAALDKPAINGVVAVQPSDVGLVHGVSLPQAASSGPGFCVAVVYKPVVANNPITSAAAASAGNRWDALTMFEGRLFHSMDSGFAPDVDPTPAATEITLDDVIGSGTSAADSNRNNIEPEPMAPTSAIPQANTTVHIPVASELCLDTFDASEPDPVDSFYSIVDSTAGVTTSSDVPPQDYQQGQFLFRSNPRPFFPTTFA